MHTDTSIHHDDSQHAVPMNSLYQRIDQVRSSRTDLPDELRSIAQEIPGSPTRQMISRLADALAQKTSAAQLVARFPEHCWLLTLRSTAATTDAMTAMLELSAYQHQLRSKKIRAIAYPLILVILALTLMLFALTWLIPPFDEMYSDFAIHLPTPTLFLVMLSRWVNQHLVLSLIVITVTVSTFAGLLWAWISDASWKQSLLGLKLTGPAIKQALANAALQIAELSDEGMELGTALNVAAESSPQRSLRFLLGDLAAQANRDPRLLHATYAASAFPPNFLLALNSPSAARPATFGPNTPMLRELAASYRDLSIRGNAWFAFVFGQITVVVIGLMIAFAIISLFAPLVSLVTSLS